MKQYLPTAPFHTAPALSSELALQSFVFVPCTQSQFPWLDDRPHYSQSEDAEPSQLPEDHTTSQSLLQVDVKVSTLLRVVVLWSVFSSQKNFAHEGS